MTIDLAEAILNYGLPTIVVVLLVAEIIVPRGRLRREELRGDKAMDIAEAQVRATSELTSAIRSLDHRTQEVLRERQRPTHE